MNVLPRPNKPSTTERLKAVFQSSPKDHGLLSTRDSPRLTAAIDSMGLGDAEPDVQGTSSHAMPTSVASAEGQSGNATLWDAFKLALKITKESVDGLPPIGLKAAVGGLLAIIETFEVHRTPVGIGADRFTLTDLL